MTSPQAGQHCHGGQVAPNSGDSAFRRLFLELLPVGSPVGLSTLSSLWVSGGCRNTSWSSLAAEPRKGRSRGVMDVALRVFFII